MDENDKIYAWIWNVIKSCNHPSHIEPSESLIVFYEKKGADEQLIERLRQALNMQILIIQEGNKAKEQASLEEEVWEMFNTGNHTIKHISERLNLQLQKCHDIINKKLK